MSILNFGSLNIDYVYGVEHFVSKGETITSRTLNVFPGGKGLNQSIALARAGADVRHAGQVGTDGVFLKELLAGNGVDVRSVAVRDDVRSGNAIIQNDAAGDNCIILFPGANRAIDTDFVDKALSGYGEGDWLLLQNEISAMPYIVSRAKQLGMYVVLNPSPADALLTEINLDLIDCFILNEGEAAMLTGIGGNDGRALASAMQTRFPHAQVILTLGERGSLAVHDGHTDMQSAYLVDTVDTTAAGDTFTGYLLAGLMDGCSMSEALETAAKASAIAVSRPGAAPSIPQREEVSAFIPRQR
ncbi:ribokinase [Bifidobacterium sp. LC6]|uniref:Ribokinase n=1 Tax=Bifidobacterium colobi TaxID=2809026 RepID=A0ABS5UWP6_9BIFI|nr:ribokinase [Bifidobacterium colobi]MBT1175009.1 ribokinase [Bifidobacterium colobi]